jgi:preprotein translocase subunit SecG
VTATLGAGQVRRSGPVLHPRLSAVVTAGSCIAHLWLVVENHHGVWLGVLMLALAAVCVPCTVHIWRYSKVAALHQVTASALVMVVVHGVLLLGGKGAGHSHSAGVTAAGDSSGAASLLAVIVLEITTALLAATLVARLRTGSRTGPVAHAS